MLFHNRFILPTNDEQDVDAAWFAYQKQRRVHKDDAALRTWLVEIVEALRAFHDGHASPEKTADDMTHSISTSPVPDLGGYSDEILGVTILWLVIITALLEWPSSRTPNLFTLLNAIAKVSDDIHRGEATDDNGKALNWGDFPYFALMWPDSLQPGQICRQSPDEASLVAARRLYLRIKDLEAQLIAEGVMGLSKEKIQYSMRALEKNLDDRDTQIAPDEATAYEQVRLDFYIPTISFMFKFNGREIHTRVVRDELKDWTKRQIPIGARVVEYGAERWSFWLHRLGELAEGDVTAEVKIAAKAAMGFMKSCDTNRSSLVDCKDPN